MASLTLRLFGAPEITAFGLPLTLPNQKAQALLFYLAVTGRPHTRSHLATLLWSEFPTPNARRSLRSTLFQLRQVLEKISLSHILVSEGDLLRLSLADDACDATDFLRLMAARDQVALRQSLPLYRGPFLQGFTLPDAPLFDEWVRQEDEVLSQGYLNILQWLADDAAAQGQVAQAIYYLHRLLQADTIAETAQQQLLRLYLKTGEFGQAIRQYQHFATMLQTRMSLTPAPETRALFQEALQRQQTPLTAKTAASTTLSSRPQPALPFVGRDQSLDQLIALSQEVQAGRGGTVLLQGDGGIGKTRLMREFLARLATANPPWLVLQGNCSPFDDLLSYGPFLEAFQDTALGDLTDLLLSPHPDAPGAREQFAYRILQTLRRLTQNAPVVLAMDDLQWANSATLNLFGLLATRIHQLPLLLLGSVQRPEAIPALQRLVTLERRRGQLQLLTVTPLSDETIRVMLHSLAIMTTAIPALAKWLQERSDGNPFVLAEMVAQLRAEAILTPVGNQWHLDPGRWLRWRATYTLPETTHDLVSWRLRHLTAEAYALIEVLAVAGQALPFALLTNFPGLPTTPLLPVIDELMHRGLLTERGREQYTLSHYLLRETVLLRLSQVRQRLIHRQLAQKLAQCPALEASFPEWEIARHAVAGEDVDLARQYGLPILSTLPQDYTGAVTVDFLHHLYDLLTPTASPDERMQLTQVLGAVHQSLGHLPEASHWQEQVLSLARQTGNTATQATAYFEQGEVALVSNDYVAATAAAESGLTLCIALTKGHPTFSNLSGRGHRLLGHALAMEGRDLLSAERHLQEATTGHRLAHNSRDLCAGLFELGNVAAQRGELLRALEFYEEAAGVAEAGQAHYFHALARNNMAYHSLLLGWLKVAQRALAHGQRLAETHELLGALLHLSSTQGEIYLYLAEWPAAQETFQQGLNLAEVLSNPERQAGYRAGLALATRGQQDLNGAVTLFEEALLLLNGRGYWHLRTRILIWLAETLLLAERRVEARPHLDAALVTAQAHGRALLHLQAQRLQASLAAADGDWPVAEACFNQALTRATSLDLPLEIARIQSAWGQAWLRFAPHAAQGQALLRQAHQVFVAHDAAAELTHLAPFL